MNISKGCDPLPDRIALTDLSKGLQIRPDFFLIRREDSSLHVIHNIPVTLSLLVVLSFILVRPIGPITHRLER